MSELKRCPFCGGEAKIDCYLYFDEFDDWFIRCTSFFCRTRTFKTKKSAILTWNNRKPMERIVERLDLRRKEYEEASNHPSIELSQECYYKGIMRGYEYSRDIVKEEGGLNE